jgi:hypothetical protein
MYDNVYLYVSYLIVLTSDKNLQVTWEPYETNEVQGMAVNAICKHDQDIWTTVVALI